MLVEPSAAGVALKCPQLQLAGLTLADQFHELVAEATAHPRRVDVQMVQPPRCKHDLADHHSIEVSDPHIHRGNGNVGDPRSDFSLGVRLGYFRQTERLRAHVDVGTRRGIGNDRLTDRWLPRLVGSQHAFQPRFSSGDCL